MSKEYTPRIINTNIKTRRLGYIVALTDLLGSNFLLIDDLERKLETWAEEHEKNLERYFSKFGFIKKSPRHYPARRYIQLAKNLRLVKISRNECALTKIGQPLLTLDKNKQNPFELSMEQKCYLLKRILENDFDYILPLLRLLEKCHNTGEIFGNFKIAVLEHLETRIKRVDDILKSSGFKKRIQLMMKWAQEKKYLEHIIYPRLDWLLDIQILDREKYKKRIYKLTYNGKAFLEALKKMEVEIDVNAWLEDHYYETFGRCFIKESVISFDALKKEERSKFVHDLLEEAFNKFSPPKLPFQHISANTFLEFSCTKLIGMKILPTFTQIKNILSSLPMYRFQWQPSMRDGFIMKI
jgi:predicted transcriptional regulator